MCTWWSRPQTGKPAGTPDLALLHRAKQDLNRGGKPRRRRLPHDGDPGTKPLADGAGTAGNETADSAVSGTDCAAVGGCGAMGKRI
ncbi:MAG: hypothetical protein Kow00114_31090 [Kiloniellaceae bacterium]